MNKQEEYIASAQEKSFSTLMVANNFFDEQKKTYQPGKRHPIGRYSVIDHITPASNQIIYELDATSYTKNYEIAKKITKALDDRKIPYNLFASGGKGIHIETWFETLDITEPSIIELYKEALSYGLSYKHIRLWFWNLILDEADINREMRGQGKILDSSCMAFDDLLGKKRLIRCVGGRKQHYDKITGDTETYYKTYIPPHAFNNKRVKIKAIDQVEYPNGIYLFKIDEMELSDLLQGYVKNAQHTQADKSVVIDPKKIGGYTNLDGIKVIREGLEVGRRAYGAQVLAIAMANDGMPREEQEALMEEYSNNCKQIDHKFDSREALEWITWMERQKFVFWNCGLLDRLQLHDKTSCAFCQEKNKDALKLLTQTTILNQIKEVLDVAIVGEDDTKMLMFLLFLSKDFPSKTGKPNWNKPGDPISQNVILASDSSSGKSWITKRVLELFGEKGTDYFILSRMSKASLNYYTETNMDGKIIFIEEMQGLDENTVQLRMWMSEGELRLLTVEKVKDEEGVEINVQVEKTTIGQPVFVTNQAEGQVDDQLNNRSWILETDTSSRQTKDILEYQDNVFKGFDVDIEAKLRNIKDALHQLKPYHFTIPFASYKDMGINPYEVRSRRDWPKLMTLIMCSAYLHQKQRAILKDNKEREYIVCNLLDYDIAVKYATSILGATFSGLTNQQINIIKHIKISSYAEEFTRNDLMRELGKSQPYWSGQLKQLCNLGYINEDSSSIGKQTIYSIAKDKAIAVINLPSSKEIAEKISPNLLQLMQGKVSMTFEEYKTQVIGSIGSLKQLKADVDLSSVGILEDDELKKTLETQKTTYYNSDLQYSSGFSHAKNSLPSSKPTFVIGKIKEDEVLDFCQKSGGHWIKVAEIIEHFGEEEKDNIERIIAKLAILGTIMKREGEIIVI